MKAKIFGCSGHRIVTPILALVLMFAWPGAAFAAGVEGEIELEPAEDETVFSYRGGTGPELWGDLDEEWEACSHGMEQSPVDFDALAAMAEEVSDISFDYHASAVSFVNNGHTVKMDYEPGSTMTLDGSDYELLQFHYHTPSEHSLQDGAHYRVEQHLVHQNASGGIVAVGVMLREGEANSALPSARRLDQYLPKAEGVVVVFPDKTIDASGLLPDNHESFRYDGSFTTPPCTEGVKWIVMTYPIEVSRGQMRALVDTLNNLKYASGTGANNRPTQPLNARMVRLDSDGG
jgi:carbonic anhydrase